MSFLGDIFSFDVFDLADPKGSSKSKFRDLPFDIIIQGVDREQVVITQKLLKSLLSKKSFIFKGPIASKYRVAVFVCKLDNSDNDHRYRNALVHQRVFKITHSLKSDVMRLIQLNTPSGVNITVSVNNGSGVMN